ncbi:unnamed protein product [Lasius platythorax]|uniref:receptor protein-tyrosine kinase n=1 Tax=Lasius platythorax TaxID=488582 RepID=A0AAV2NT84_9HYME
MLRMLKKLCILLKVLMLTAIAFSEGLENLEASDIPVFQSIDVRDYMSSNNESVQNYSDNVTVKNEVEGIPSEPTFPRTFVEFGNILNRTDIFVTFRWNKPVIISGMIQKYRIQYWFIENLKKIQTSVEIIPANNKILQHKVYDLKPDTMYYFKVQAHNKVGGGPYTNFINVSTTHENPIPLLLVRTYSGVHVLDIDLQISFDSNIYGEFVYSALEHKIYEINAESELMTCDFNLKAMEIKRNCTKIIDIDSSADNLCIDWVARNLYWTIPGDNDEYYIMKLDLTLWQQMDITNYDNIIKMDFSFLKVLPSAGYLYWWAYKWTKYKKKYEYVLMKSDLNGKNIKPFFKNENNKFCPYNRLGHNTYFLDIDTTYIEKPLIYWILDDSLYASDIFGWKCNLILSTENGKHFYDLAIDKINIYLYIRDDNLIHILNKKYVLLESKENALKHVTKVNISLPYPAELIVLNKSLQPFPPTICLTPNMKDYRVEEVNTTTNSITVNLPEPIPNAGCEKYNLATTIYSISVNYLTCLDNDHNKLEEFNVQTHKQRYEFQDLTPFTEYTLKLALSNFYVDKLSMDLQFGADVKLTTKGKLNSPENVTVQVLTPTLAAVYWMPPKKLNCAAVKYQVHCMQLSNSTQEKIPERSCSTNFIDKPKRTLDGKFFTIIQSLLPKQKYQMHVSVLYSTVDINLFSDSLPKIVYMSVEPNNLILSGVSTNCMNISWIRSANLTIYTGLHYILEYKYDAMREWQIANNTEENNEKVTYYIENLLPRTPYNFRLILRYPEYKQDFIWSPDGEEFTFETLGNETKIPSAPGIPTVTRLSNFTYQLNWEPAQANDSQYLILYRLEGLVIENNYTEANQIDKNEHWNLYYNGTDNYFIIAEDMDQKYQFRVQAENAYGVGVWSKSSTIIDLTESNEISSMQYYLPLILILVVIIVIYNVYYFYRSYRQRKKNRKIMIEINSINVNDTPSENVQTNAVYDPMSQYNLEKFALTIIEKKQITLGNLLGSGAFGKVHQGILKNFEGSDTMPVAIKMLPENATSREKMEFLEEANRMSDFRHKHVLKLLGICVDTELPWLILELMEAGDLLQYLRESRTLQPSDRHALRLQDLLAMCEDVARGCRYLEEQNFVHRDLACRNCLISGKNRKNRIVKIGDFGLARNMYKDDYYRMKGETSLPVRWMAPESLVDGIFTSQSDVWAFGVLMWEITSLGQKPYSAINNWEVREYVCAGNKLLKPLNCPHSLYQLMLSCWNAVKERPKFKLCLENIVTLRSNIEDAMLISMDIIRHVERPPSEITEYLQMKGFAGSTANCTSERLIANDTSNDIIEPWT